MHQWKQNDQNENNDAFMRIHWKRSNEKWNNLFYLLCECANEYLLFAHCNLYCQFGASFSHFTRKHTRKKKKSVESTVQWLEKWIFIWRRKIVAIIFQRKTTTEQIEIINYWIADAFVWWNGQTKCDDSGTRLLFQSKLKLNEKKKKNERWKEIRNCDKQQRQHRTEDMEVNWKQKNDGKENHKWV